MKLLKYMVVFAFAFCAFAGRSNATTATVQLVGGGSSAIFLELGQAAFGIAGEGCVWTSKSDPTILSRDDRTSTATDEKGNYWVVWGPGSGTCAAPAGAFNVYSYEQLDSVVGDKCYFMVNSSSASGCIQVFTTAASTVGANLLGTGFTDTNLPATVSAAVNGLRYNFIGTDIRPEDAKFASKRMFTTCGTSLSREPFGASTYSTQGLGYQTGTTGVGTSVLSFFSTKKFNVLDFNITGTDPITGKSVRAFNTTTIGAQPIVVVVSSNSGAISAATNVPRSTLAKFMDGTLGRTTDLPGVTGTAAAVTMLTREPLSGTYNTIEYSIPNTVEFRTSQDVGNCSGTSVNSNPMNIASANGKVTGAARKRVIGTGEMITQIQAGTSTDNRLGYFFWSAGNASSFTSTNGKYLTVDGVDPIADNYSKTNGVLPVGTTALANVTFSNLNAGSYPIWSAVRLVNTAGVQTQVNTLITALQTLNSTQHDFVTLANLAIWHSHFPISSIGVTTGANGATINTANDLCNAGKAEAGGDAGGATVLKVNNLNYCADFSSTLGLIDLNN
jgi:hypothetical protein